jgi:glycosyltransferase involved in cell wall biosynthesis
MPEVSVIIPALNAQAFIGEAIESALRQTLIAAEIIVVDDGSSDKTAEIVKSFDSGVILVLQHNQGSGSARNNGIMRSKGKWVAFLDADDAWEKDHVETLFNTLCQDPNTVLAYSGKIWVDKNGLVIPSKSIQNEYPSGWIFNKLLEDNYISSASCVMAKRDVLLSCGGFRTDPVFRNSQDYEFWLRISASHPVASTSRKSVRYRLHDNNQVLKASEYAIGHLSSIRSGCSLLKHGKVNPSNEPDQIYSTDRLRRAYKEAIISTFYFSDYKASRYIFWQMLCDRIFDPTVIYRGIICHAPKFIVNSLRSSRRTMLKNEKASGGN